MGYQALLFCPDEKLARVVSQVFTELDFSIEHVQEPFGAVKRLMAQHYDAVVVDCENDPNAALLFKSARNSSANQSSLAIAVVEGQAGIAKAYRIGANLVLTKPINVEQCKGTLRVARGLLRKTADAGTATSVNAPAVHAASVTATAPPASVPVEAVSRSVEPVAAPANQSALPEFETPLAAMATSAEVEESPVATPAHDGQARPQAMAQPLEEGRIQTEPEQAKPQAALVASKVMESPAASFLSGQGAAAAPAPARETPAEKKTVEFEAAYQKDDNRSTFGSASVTDGPSFARLDEENAGSSGGSKKILVAAAAVLALATLGYVGWTKLSAPKMGAPSSAVSEPQPSPQRATAPMAVPVTIPATVPTNRADANTSVGTSKMASATAPPAVASSPVLRIDVNSKPETKSLDVTRILVKTTPTKQSSARTEEAAAQLPSPLAVGASSENGLSSLTAPSVRSQPSLVKVNISQGVSQGLLIKRVQPMYPQNGVARHLQGAVQLSAMIDKEGRIVNLKVLKGDAVLARAAMDAVRQWRYKPYYLDGVPVEIETQITVNFRLPN
jgi:TonB family protein